MGSEEVRYHAVVDVGPIALCIVKNPVQEEALSWLSRVLRGEERCVIPLTSIMGAHIVATRYLRADSREVAKRLRLLLSARGVLWFSDLSLERVRRALRNCERYGVDSWDGYLLTIMEDFGIKTVYTLDLEDFSRVPWVEARLPVSKDALERLHRWLKEKLRAHGNRPTCAP